MAILNQTNALLSATQESAVVRTGVVTSTSATYLTVLVSGTQINASFIRGSGILVGDLVAVLRQDASWLCLGALAGFGPNDLFNPSFELQGQLVATVPNGWVLTNVTGTSTVDVVSTPFAPDGNLVAQINPAASARECILNSVPVPVTAGDTYAVSGFFAGLNPTSTAVVDASLRVFFATTDTTAYASGSDTLIASGTDIPNAPPFLFLSGNVTVPATMAYMRFGFRCVLPINGGMQLDFAVARKVG